MNGEHITLSCGTGKQGSYLLFIRLDKPLQLTFGHFLKGRPLFLEAGSYLYAGSALGKQAGGYPLARRLLRHTARTGRKKPHAIRKILLSVLREKGLAPERLLKPAEKKLHWHIDYLLDRPEAALVHILIIQSPEKLEPALARFIETAPETSIPAKMLGAQDTKAGTHLLSCSDPAALLGRLRAELPHLVTETASHAD